MHIIYTAHLRQQCHNSKFVIFQEKRLKVLKCYSFLWVQRRHNCSPAASFANCVITLYLLKVHLQTFLSIPVTKKCQILSCDILVANERYVDWSTALTSRKVTGSITDGVIGIFHWHKCFRSHCGPGVDSASIRNEYQGYFLGGKGGRCVGLTTLPPSCADCLEIWEPQPPGTLWACPGLQWDCFTLYIYIYIYSYICYNERGGILSADVTRACAWRFGLSCFDESVSHHLCYRL